MPKRTLQLSKEHLTELDPADLVAVAGAGGTLTFEHLRCHPTFRLECSAVVDCWRTS